MTGYDLIGKMRKTRRRYSLTATEQALYGELVAICNEDGWQDTFLCSNGELCRLLRISENTLNTSRLTLIQAGLLSYQSGKSKKQVGRYSFIDTVTTSNIDTNTDTKADTKADTNTDTKAADSKNKVKQKLKLKKREGDAEPLGSQENKKPLPIPELAMPWGDDFKKMWEQWKIYKHTAKNFKYSTIQSEQAALNILTKKSNGIEAIAIEIINQSMANKWQGFFELKNNQNGQSTQRTGDNISIESMHSAFAKYDN